MLFSIITINYNNLNGLKRTVESVLKQRFKDFQYLVIDGGSNDGSKEYIESIDKENGVLLSEKDNGIYDAMNKGLELSKGNYVIFLNSGDFFPSEYILSNITSEIKRSSSKVDFLYGDAYEYSLKSNEYYYKKARNHTKAWYGMFAHHQSMVYSNEIIKNNNLKFDLAYKLSSDWDFTFRFLSKSNNFIKVNLALSVFEQGGFSDRFIIGLNEQFRIRRKTLRFNIIKCSIIYLYLFILNVIRKTAPIIYHTVRMRKEAPIKNL